MKNKHVHPSAKFLALGLVAAAALDVGNSAQADLIITMTETGSGVRLTGSGSFNFGGSLTTSTTGFGAIVNPQLAFFDPGPLKTGHALANGAIISGPTSIGSGSSSPVATSSSGEAFGVRVQFLNDVYLPSGYTSGAA